MSNKKILLVVSLFFLFLIFANILIKAQENVPFSKETEKLGGITEKLTDEEARREYLQQAWEKIILKNKVFASVNSFFTRISIVFRILFGMPYSISLTLFFVIILWIIIAVKSADITTNGIGLPEAVSYGIGIVAAVILAQLQILRRIILFLTKFIFSQEGTVARFVVGAIIVGILVLIYVLGGVISQVLKQRKKEIKEEEAEQKQKEIKKFTKGLESK